MLNSKIVLIFIGGLLAILLFSFSMNMLGVEWFGFFGKKVEQKKTEIYHESYMYNDGINQQLSKFHGEYLDTENQAKREMIKSRVVEVMANYDPAKIPNQNLRMWVHEMMER